MDSSRIQNKKFLFLCNSASFVVLSFVTKKKEEKTGEEEGGGSGGGGRIRRRTISRGKLQSGMCL